MVSGIYKIRNILNNKLYIGSTKQFILRFSTHKNLLRKNKHENPYLQNSWNKYGEENFKFEILIELSNSELDNILKLEEETIVKYNTLNRKYGYNICKVGKSRLGTKWSEESKLKRTGKGNPMFGKGYLRTGKNNPMFGKTLTKLHKERMSKSLTGLKKPMISIKQSKPVNQIDMNTLKIINKYKSVTIASKKTNILHIGEVCNNKRNSAGGFKWKWNE